MNTEAWPEQHLVDASVLSQEPLSSGKVREMYAVDEDRLLMVASDRVSTYDVVHPTLIPDKGKVLTGLSAYWFSQTRQLCRDHLLSCAEVPEAVRGRAMLVERLRMLPIECVVRGYITGSGWKDYQESGTICGLRLPPSLVESERLPEPIFTPASKAEIGEHDENISAERAAELLGDDLLFENVRQLSLSVYNLLAEQARERGIILADTKFEWGLDKKGQLVLADEVGTPDSSRFWPADNYRPGQPQPSFDKQYIRDWASDSGWDHEPPAPMIPETVVAGTRQRYLEAYQRITGADFAHWLQYQVRMPVSDPEGTV